MIASVTTLAVRFVTVAVLCAQTTATAPATKPDEVVVGPEVGG
jgi:hypothetical protein